MVATTTNSWNHQQHRNSGSSSNGGAVVQQRSPRTKKKLLSNIRTSPSSSSPSPNKISLRHHHGPTGGPTISVRVVVYRLLAVFALLFLGGIVMLTVLWNPRQGNNDGQHHQPQPPNLRILSSGVTRRKHQHRKRQLIIKTPFDGLDASKTRQKILAWLNKTQEEESMSSSTSNTTAAAATSDAIMKIDPNLRTWDRSLVHIVNTRFMQEQGHLKALGRARLHLFRTFCLPTMVHQSTQKFLWIIKTDPKLDMDLLQDLIDDLKRYPNIYLVSSNVNYMIRENHKQATNRHSWRDGAEIEDILHSTIYTGDPTTLYQAMLQKDKQVILETRLDADDGLHKLYLQQIQEKALDQFDIIQPSSSDEEEDQGEEGSGMTTTTTKEPYIPPRWLYWCTRRHVEWHGGVQMTPSFTKTINDTMVSSSVPDYYGNLLVIEHSKLCITPGITVGFGIGTPSQEVPIHAHDKLFQAIHSLKPEDACGYTQVSDCLELVEDMLLVAVRARTPTSAGMQRVMGTDMLAESSSFHGNNNSNTADYKMKGPQHEPPQPSPLKTYLYWDLLHDDFALLREQIQYTNRYILNHLVPIAEDNLEGQCTSDHSCKNETREKLLKIIQDHQ